ncbi:LYR motif containing protein 1 isoform X7 [Rhinoraja longicauda]
MVLDVKECIKVDKSPVSDGIYPRLHLREEIGGTRWRSLHPYEPKLTDAEAIKNCITECHTRIEMGLHYRIPYPRPIHLPPMGLADKKGRKFKMQERLRKFAKPVYLQSHEEIE